jgi:hypothetical protein
MMLISLQFNQWWQALSAPHQVFWFIAIVFSVLFAIQFIFSFIGLDEQRKEFDIVNEYTSFRHEFSALNARSIIAFFTFFGWTGVIVLHQSLSIWMATTFASFAGLCAMFAIAYLSYKFSQIRK